MAAFTLTAGQRGGTGWELNGCSKTPWCKQPGEGLPWTAGYLSAIHLTKAPAPGGVVSPGKKTNKRHPTCPSAGTGWGMPSPRGGEEPSARRAPYSRAQEVGEHLGKKETLSAPPASSVLWPGCTALAHTHTLRINMYICSIYIYICAAFAPTHCKPHHRHTSSKGTSVTQGSGEDCIEAIFIPCCKPADYFPYITNRLLDT